MSAPLVCLHGFMDTWRTWDAVRPYLEPHHGVHTPALAGHANGPRIDGPISERSVPDAVERCLDGRGIELAHFAGNSLGGFTALTLAARGRALSVVAFAPAGGWTSGDLFNRQEGIRAAGLVNAPQAREMLAFARAATWDLDAASILCPVRIVWGTEDEFLPWPEAASRYREWLPHADWVELDGVGHQPQVERPLEAAQLILGATHA